MEHIKMIESVDLLEKILQKNNAIIMKNSNRCSISRSVRVKYEVIAEKYGKNNDFYMIDVVNNKNISNALEEKTNIRHESPQIIIIHEGKVIWHASHWEIKTDEIEKYITK
ncbi:MAG: bacillithiol system redox-active protein YtxJ [Candidatus Latescibacteria bacterium]|nr:bacillithiol system redox-active protein YtxJ [Candidatus Latescibacterota bacterium]